MGRKRMYENAAEKTRAFRARIREKAAAAAKVVEERRLMEEKKMGQEFEMEMAMVQAAIGNRSVGRHLWMAIKGYEKTILWEFYRLRRGLD